MQRDIVTVSELNRSARQILEEAFLPIWVSGEVSNFTCASSGHWYFSLKDKQAQVSCAMFRNRNYHVKTLPKNGMQVLVNANVSLYENRGNFQLIINELEEAGDGALLRAFEALKARLQKEDLFNQEHKRTLPSLPQCIGVITSPTGAAIRDVLSVLKRRFPSIPVIVYPSQVQGNAASQQLIDAVKIANRRNECDVLILTRGGGSMEDLWCFNDETLARTIFSSKIPIVSAVGHEIDFTITDFVADKRAPTPSVAAELVSPDRRKYLHDIQQLYTRLSYAIQLHINQAKRHCLHLQKRLRHPGQQLREYTQRIDQLAIRLQQAQLYYVRQRQQQLQQLSRLLHEVSPLATLARGYAIVRDEKSNDVIKQAKSQHIGQRVRARLAEGELVCDVVAVND